MPEGYIRFTEYIYSTPNRNATRAVRTNGSKTAKVAGQIKDQKQRNTPMRDTCEIGTSRTSATADLDAVQHKPFASRPPHRTGHVT